MAKKPGIKTRIKSLEAGENPHRIASIAGYTHYDDNFIDDHEALYYAESNLRGKDVLILRAHTGIHYIFHK